MVIFNSYVSHYQRVTMIIQLMKPWSSNCFRPSYWDRQVARVTRPSGHGIFRASNGHRMEALHGKSICQMDENWEYIYILFPIYSETNQSIYIYISINTEYFCTIFFMKVYSCGVFFRWFLKKNQAAISERRLEVRGEAGQKSWWSGWLKGLKFVYKPSPISGGLTMVYKTEIGDGVLTPWLYKYLVFYNV